MTGTVTGSEQDVPPRAAGGAALEIHDLVAGYGLTRVLNGISFTVPAGSAVALLGPNGAGKTTTLRAVSGLLRPSAGKVLLDGRDVTGAKPHQLAGLGVCHLPEGRGIYPTLTVRENLTLHAPHQTRKFVVEQAVTHFPILGKKLRQPARQLSGGQQQMLAVVRSYIAEPRLVLVDEVSMGLAPVVVDEIYAFLRSIAAAGTSLLLVEQYVARALAIADSVVLLTKGRIAFHGAPAEIEQDVFEHYMGASAAVGIE